MNKNVRWRLIVTAAVLLIFAMVGVYPLLAARLGWPAPGWLASRELKLGLDLKGGVHLVLRVITDDALRVETETEMERVREALRTAGITVGSITAPSPAEFRVEGVPPGQNAAVQQATADTIVNFDRATGANGSYTFTLKPNVQQALRTEAVAQAQQTIERRINELGVAEPQIAQQGSEGNQILVQLPGVTDVNRAKDLIQSTGLLELKIVEGGPAGTREELMVSGQVPEGMEVVPGADTAGGAAGTTVYYLVRRAAGITGRDLRNARPTLDEFNQPAVSFTLSSDGATRFGQLTEQNINRQLAIILDGRLQSAPTIQSRITSEGRITGAFTQQDVADLALVLRSGALPARMEYLEERVIGPTLGADSIRSGVIASIGGFILVMIFMLAYYKGAGINAMISVFSNLLILLGMMAYLGGIMTLPGFAGFILTVGVGVDSNVLIFERIKEELAAGRPVRAAVNAGFDRVWGTIVDTHVASLIAAAFLFNFGTGPIRGFATTLAIGLLANVFTAVFVSRTIFEWRLSGKREARLAI
ncbi:MAG: protein translocase subunit SecD [Vicinamibacterales bacterium]